MRYEYSCSGGLTVTPPLSPSEAKGFLAYADTVDDPDAPVSRYCPFELYDGGDYIHCSGTLDESPLEWISYLNKKFFAPRGHVLDGEILVLGEAEDDRAVITVNRSTVDEFVLPSVDESIRQIRALRDAKGVLDSDLSEGDKLNRIAELLGLEREGIGL